MHEHHWVMPGSLFSDPSMQIRNQTHPANFKVNNTLTLWSVYSLHPQMPFPAKTLG